MRGLSIITVSLDTGFLPETSDWLVSARKRHFSEVSGLSCGEDGWTDGQTDNVVP